MKISLEWLREYLDAPSDAHAFGDALTMGGLPVEVFEQHGDDMVIDVEVTSNRGDCLSHVGVARELSALIDRPFKEVQIKTTEAGEPHGTSVRIDAPNLCPHYIARVIRNVKVGPSPAWMMRRLEALGLRAINNVVDITNYVMFELGQPLHAFDFDKLAEKRIVVRKAQKGETIVSIDGHTRQLSPEMLVIADANRPAALAGVMGGRDSEVSSSTKTVLLESARFDPLSIRKTARALAMKSDSSYRFERGIDPTLPERASRRAAQLLCELAGGELLAGSAVAGSEGYSPKRLVVPLAKFARLLGVDLGAEQIVAALRRIHLSPTLRGDAVEVNIPSHRLDLNIEPDIIEEAARVAGYDKIPTKDQIEIRLQPQQPEYKTIDQIRTTLTAAGFYEAITVSFVSDLLAGDFVPAEASGLPQTDAAVRKADAKLRPSLLPGLLEAVRRNESVGNAEIRLFEIGSTFYIDRSNQIQQPQRVAVVTNGDLREIRGAVESLLTRLNKDRSIDVKTDSRAGLAPGVTGRINWGGEGVGWIGKIDPKVAAKIDLRGHIVAAELDLATLLAGMQHVPQLHPLPRFPAVQRDLSLVVPEHTAFEQIEQTIRSAKPESLQSLEYVTTYRGKPLEKGQKSVTVTLIFRSDSATLTSEQVEPSVQRVIDAAKASLGASLRA